MQIAKCPFGQLEGSRIDLYTLENDHGMAVRITNYGGIVTSIIAPDKNGQSSDIVCGFDSLDGYFSAAYTENSPFFGCLVGRYAGRIKDGKFSIGGRQYQVATNDGPNHLHGGIKGFDKCVWDVAGAVENDNAVALELALTSDDGDESFPGTVTVAVEYRLTNDNELCIHYQAQTDQVTPLSLTNHTYFNLNGFQDQILDHDTQIFSDRYLVPDDTNVPVGDEAAVAGTVCDFNKPQRIGNAFRELPMGFEHYYVFRKPIGSLEKVAQVTEASSGRKLEVFSSEPGALFYTGRYTSDNLCRESGAQYGQFRAFCIETSKYPNGPNIPGSPDSVLEPGAAYDDTTIYKLSWA